MTDILKWCLYLPSLNRFANSWLWVLDLVVAMFHSMNQSRHDLKVAAVGVWGRLMSHHSNSTTYSVCDDRNHDCMIWAVTCCSMYKWHFLWQWSAAVFKTQMWCVSWFTAFTTPLITGKKDVMFFPLHFCGSFCEHHADEPSVLLHFTSCSWSQVGLHHAQKNYEDRIYQVDAHHSNQLHELRQRRGVWI